MSNLEMAQNEWEDARRLYADTTSFYIRDLGICGFGCPGAPRTNPSVGTKERL